MISTLKKQPDGTIELTITIPEDLVKKTWEEVTEDFIKSASVPGFRKGKAPKKLLEGKLDKSKIKEEVLKRLLPTAYLEAVKKHNLRPIINPKIHIGELKEGADWQFTVFTCETPGVELNSYKQAIQKVTVKGKIVIPGKEPKTANFEDIIKALLESINIVIPKVLKDLQVEKLLAQTLDEIKRLGLSLDQYLASTGKTPESLRDEYEKKAEDDIRLEFALQKIAEEEKIVVEEKEIEEAIQKAKDENERKNLESNRYLLASILRQQKTLDFLKNL